ncbi:alpha/beta hydrolase, partial [Patescibacteria group bacterium]|nr:alpha/beta hydrolase [Patescibacteria group bacterium]
MRIPDLAGHGQTPLPHAYTIDDYTQDVVNFIENTMHNAQCIIHNDESEESNPKSLIIIAHSNGGRIALHLAATHPDLVDQLILVNSAGIDLSYDPSRYRTIKRVVFPSIAKIMKYIIPQRLLSPLYRLLGGHDYLATAHDPYLRETFVTMLHTELENDMQNIDTQTIPTTLIRG